MDSPFTIETSPDAGSVRSVRLYERELLDAQAPGISELWVNGLPLSLRKHHDPNDPNRELLHLKGERFINQLSGWGLVMARQMGERSGMKHPCFGIQTHIRREACDQTCPPAGPGGPVVEAPLHIDTLSILNWNWQFWGDDTRMIFPSSHASGPTDAFGHAGYEHDTPATVKKYLGNIWRRIYPGCMVIHGGLFYSARDQHWLAITCRRPSVGYHLNIEQAGQGVSYDFTLHAPLHLGEFIRLPEIKLYYGPDRDSMMRWLADYVTQYYQPAPQWVGKKVFGGPIAWNNSPTWAEQADAWEKDIADKQYSAIHYCLVTERPIKSGTTPLSYAPDSNYGSRGEFKAMCRRMADQGVPILIWMSHSGLAYFGHDDIDDDWFIRGIDGKICAAWGNIDHPDLAHINPGHPGYIEYTKKWIRFYIGECRCKGIFFDCLSWAFPPDFKPRHFMRYPGDTNRMAIRFMDEAYAEIKRCDPEAIMLGEGASFDGPVNVVAIHSNPKRAIDGLGPRDFLLSLNRWSDKRLTIDQGPYLAPASGYCRNGEGAAWRAMNRQMVDLLARSDPNAFVALPGDLSLLGSMKDAELLVVPLAKDPQNVALPTSAQPARRLQLLIGRDGAAGQAITIDPDHQRFSNVPTGVYRIERTGIATGDAAPAQAALTPSKGGRV